jgi:hypothetical protein
MSLASSRRFLASGFLSWLPAAASPPRQQQHRIVVILKLLVCEKPLYVSTLGSEVRA